jgi:D-lactate dehydrogenase
MAPFVEYEWGKDAYEIMKKIKKIFDPDNLFNPGVLINSDNQVHLKNLKLTPASNEIIDKCIECGFCENVCPSKDITITPRQRIAVWREITHLKNTQENHQRLSELKNSFKYYGDYTCATDGLCALSCPVDIDTGKFIKKIREENLADNTKKFAELIARHLKLVTETGRIGLNILDTFHSIFGSGFMKYLTDGLRKISNNHLPKWSKTLPKGANAIYPSSVTNQDELTVVYFPSCINRTMGIQHKSNETESETTVMHRLLTKAGYKIKYPDGLKNLCCGMPFCSKGLIKQADKKAEELRMSLIYASQNGKFPIVYDMSPCLKTTKEHLKTVADNRLKVYDVIEFIHDFLLDKLEIKKIDDTIAVHPVCSVVTMGIDYKLKAIAETCANKIVVPENITCCGFAGDRGFTFPELNASALKELKTSLPTSCRNGYSTSRTCEIGLSLHSGIEYKSIVYLVDKVSKAK